MPPRSIVSVASTGIGVGKFNRQVASIAGALLRARQTGKLSDVGLRGVGASGAPRAPIVHDTESPWGLGISVQGIEEASLYLANVADAVREAATASATVRSDLPYAYGINFGRHRGGSLARRAGGTFSLLGALLAVYPRVAPEIAEALPHGPAAVRKVIDRLARSMLSEVRTREVRLSGDLRKSYYAVVPRENNPRVYMRGLRGLSAARSG